MVLRNGGFTIGASKLIIFYQHTQHQEEARLQLLSIRVPTLPHGGVPPFFRGPGVPGTSVGSPGARRASVGFLESIFIDFECIWGVFRCPLAYFGGVPAIREKRSFVYTKHHLGGLEAFQFHTFPWIFRDLVSGMVF